MVGTRSTRNKGREPKREPLRERTLSYDNPNALGDAGEDQAARQESGKLSVAAKDIARYLEINRSIDWNEKTGPQRAGAGKQRTASVLQRRGDIARPACSRCEQGSRVFGSCVAAPVISGYAFQSGACANCIWDGKEKACSLRGETMPLDSVSVRQFTGEGFNLRHAIREEAWIDGDPSQPDLPEPPEMDVFVDAASEIHPPSEDSDKGNDDKGSNDRNSSDKENVDVAGFFNEFKLDSSFARIGTSQHGPRCHFDGVELKFPISREIWKSERRLLKARSDLAHFVAIIDTRLFEMGYARSDAVFWEREARRMTRLFATGKRSRKDITAPIRRRSLTPPPKIVVSEANAPSLPLQAPHPTQTKPPQRTEDNKAPDAPSQRLLPPINIGAKQSSRPPTIATSSRDRSVWDRPGSPDYSDKENESRSAGPVHEAERFENLHDAVKLFEAAMKNYPKAAANVSAEDPPKEPHKAPTEGPTQGPAEGPAEAPQALAPAKGASVGSDEEGSESRKHPATENVRPEFTDRQRRAAGGTMGPIWTMRRSRPEEFDEGPPPIASKRHRSERHGDRARE